MMLIVMPSEILFFNPIVSVIDIIIGEYNVILLNIFLIGSFVS